MTGLRTTFKVPEESYEGLGILASFGRDRIAKLISELSDQQLTLDFGAVVARLAEGLDVPESTVDSVLSSALIPLNQICQRYARSPREFVAALGSSVEEQASSDWLERHAASWREVVSELEPLFAPGKFLRLASKSVELLYDRPALLLDFRILTELRPLYDEDASKIRALLLTNTLVIEFQQGETEQALHLSIDNNDLSLIRNQLDRVLKKNALVSSEAGNWKLDLLTSEEQD